MITLKLLSAVLNENVLSVDFAKEGDRGQSLSKNQLIIVCVKEGKMPHRYFINIYELAFKCKEWAFNEGYWLQSYTDGRVYLTLRLQTIPYTEDIIFKVNTEIEGVFKACEYINNKERTSND